MKYFDAEILSESLAESPAAAPVKKKIPNDLDIDEIDLISDSKGESVEEVGEESEEDEEEKSDEDAEEESNEDAEEESEDDAEEESDEDAEVLSDSLMESQAPVVKGILKKPSMAPRNTSIVIESTQGDSNESSELR